VRLLEEHARAELGWKFGDVYSAAGGWWLRHTNVEPGPFSAPRVIDPALQTGTSYTMPTVRLTRDTRDLAFAPTRGSLTEAYAQYSAHALGSSSSVETYGGDWRLYVPTAPRFVTALHARGEWSGGGEVPFTALSMLGGARSLRGFDEGRFQDRGLAFANVEERWMIHSIEILRNPTEFQIAPFLEAGTVFPAPDRARVHDVETVAGVAFRAIVKPSVVGRIDVGVGREGAAVYVGIDYPF
jgi:outer membrane protein assembly factor BamA